MSSSKDVLDPPPQGPSPSGLDSSTVAIAVSNDSGADSSTPSTKPSCWEKYDPRKSKQEIFRIAGRSTIITVFVLLVILIVCIIAISVERSTPRPIDYESLGQDKFVNRVNLSNYAPLDNGFEWNVLLDAHVHTVYSDGVMDERQIVWWAQSKGINAMVVTDHNTIEGGLAVEKYVLENNIPIVVIPGIEHTSCRLHMNLIGIREQVPLCGDSNGPSLCPFPTDDQIRKVINRTHELGGLVFVNHLPWSLQSVSYDRDEPRMQDHPSLEQLLAWGIDGIEVVNGDTFDLRSYQFARKNNLTVFANSDVHVPMAFYGGTVLKSSTNPPTNASVMNALRSRNTSIIFDPTGSPYPVSDRPMGSGGFASSLAWIGFGEYISGLLYTYSPGMYSFQKGFCHKTIVTVNSDQVGWLILWILLILALSAILWLLLAKGVVYGKGLYDNRKNKNKVKDGM